MPSVEETREAQQAHGARLQVLSEEHRLSGDCDAVLLAAFAARPVVDLSHWSSKAYRKEGLSIDL